MKKRILVLASLIILSYGCSESNPIVGNDETFNLQEKALMTPLTFDVSKADFKFSKTKAVTRTIKIHRSSGHFDFLYPSTECPENIQVLIIGTGNATFLGNFDVINKYCFDGEKPVGPIYGFLTAANGDEIHTQMIGATELPAPEISNFDYIILGGTGRFEDASGFIQMYGTIDRVNFIFDLEGEGEITF